MDCRGALLESSFFQAGFAVTLFVYIIASDSGILDKLRAEQLASSVKTGADRADRAINELRDFLVGKSFDIAKDDDRTEILG